MDEIPPDQVVVDCSVMAKWVLPAEEYADQAFDLLRDQRAGAVEFAAPDLLPSEIGSAMLRAVRTGRITEARARENTDSLDVPAAYYTTRSLVANAFDIALTHNQRIYDCFYVALAEKLGAELWTGDERLYNALHRHSRRIHFIADYVARA